jgi:outer membrane protein assembly factor BamE (lipoprotein component of BamABCDE complex)
LQRAPGAKGAAITRALPSRHFGVSDPAEMANAEGRSMRAPARSRNRPRLALLLAPLLLGGALLAGCEAVKAPRDVRGNRVTPELLAEIVPGVQTRSDVAALLGSPSVPAAFDDVTWYYVGGMTRQRIGQMQALDDQQVVAVRFSPDGTVANVERLTLDDATRVQPVARITPTPGTETSLMQQIFGNVGRFTPGGGRTQSGGSGGGL